MNFTRISVLEARLLLETSGGERAQIADIRDELAYNDAHIENAVNVNNNNLQDFIDNADVDAPVLIYCYHGNLSQGAAAYLAEQGFKHAYSLDGGYEAWKNS